jgi:hypothetical protein
MQAHPEPSPLPVCSLLSPKALPSCPLSGHSFQDTLTLTKGVPGSPSFPAQAEPGSQSAQHTYCFLKRGSRPEDTAFPLPPPTPDTKLGGHGLI